MSLLPLNLIRYLIVCRVNAPMVWLTLYTSLEFSLVLGTLIAESLPTVQAKPWKKAMLPWKEYGGIGAMKKKSLQHVPDVTWPIESVLFSYPGKKAYGEGEPIFLELKLIGESADHAHFLEVILPALEKAGSTVDRYWQAPNALWGKFDVQSILVARGPVWEPLVEEGRLDLHYKPTPSQWSEGLNLLPDLRRSLSTLNWITPFDLDPPERDQRKRVTSGKITPMEVPSLSDILNSFIVRMNGLSTGKRGNGSRFWDLLSLEDRAAFEAALGTASTVQMRHATFLGTSPLRPGRWIGRQEFSPIPKTILPYLSLASIFHIGGHTHFGCGTFALF